MASVQQEVGSALTVMGIDPSSRKIAAIGHTDDLGWFSQTWSVPTKVKERCVVLHEFVEPYAQFVSSLVVHGPVWVFVENPVVGRGGPHATIVQAQVQGLIMGLSMDSGAQAVYPVNVQTWKKAIVGKGNASKPDVAAWLGAHRPALADMAGDDQDLVDAACIALYGIDVIQRGEQLAAQ